MDSISRSHLQRVVVGNEKNVKDCRGRKIPSQETAGVRKNCLGVDDRQTEEGEDERRSRKNLSSVVQIKM